MERWLIKLNSDRGDYIVQNWSKVAYDNDLGYMAKISRQISVFVDLDYNVFLIGFKKMPTRRQQRKWWKKLIDYGWAYAIKEEDVAPFGEEFEPQLPFDLDGDIIVVDGGR